MWRYRQHIANDTMTSNNNIPTYIIKPQDEHMMPTQPLENTKRLKQNIEIKK